MAFDLNTAGGYGTGSVGDFTLDSLTPLAINWSATVSAISDLQAAATTLTLTNLILGSNDPIWSNVGFKVGTEVLIHVDGDSAGNAVNNANAKTLVGRWIVATITESTVADANGGTITVNKNLSEYNSVADAGCVLKVTNIPHFKNLTLNAGSSIIPNLAGNPVVFKCSETVSFNGGHINLSGFGNATKLRPVLNQESAGTLDTDKYSGWENSATKDRFVINHGDGAVFIIAKNITVADDTSRIGNPNSQGVQYCRGASDSYNVPSGVTNVGGSTIFICAGTFTNFTPSILAKYRTGTATDGNGTGFARCYIASGTKLRNDEGLYAYDNISKPTVVTNTLKIKSFGDGSSGSSTASVLWSNYANVTAFNSTRKVLTVSNMTTNGAVQFEAGALVMVHAKNQTDVGTQYAGRFYVATILGVNGNDITLDTAAPYNTFNKWLSTYYVQILTIPQFTNFRPNQNVGTQIPAWSDSNGYGGIFAIACNDTCDLSERAAIVTGKGGGVAYGNNGLAHIGNAQDNDILPVGQGHGSIFILAKNLVMDSATRIGAAYSGAVSDGGDYGGDGGGHATLTDGGGYTGETCTRILNALHPTSHGQGGSGSGGGNGSQKNTACGGGYGSNARAHGVDPVGQQGAHIMIIADTITGFNQAAISTGGSGGCLVNPTDQYSANNLAGENGSAGYGGGGASSHNADGKAVGGGGGYNGGGGGGFCATCDSSHGTGGGGAGWAFIYCNNVVDQDTTDTVVD